VILAVTASGLAAQAQARSTITVGPREDVIRPFSYGLTNIPDGSLAVFRADGRYHWLLGAWPPRLPPATRAHTFLFSGRRLNAMRPLLRGGLARSVIATGLSGHYDDQVATNGSAYYDPARRKLYYFYQATKGIPVASYEAKRRRLGEGRFYPGYGSIALAVSRDLGRRFTKAGVVVRLHLGERRFLADAAIGYADPTPPAVVRRGRWLYMYYVDYLESFPFGRLAVARLRIADLDRRPQPWHKYRAGRFEEPGRGGRFTAVAVDAVFPTVVYSSYLGAWLMVHAGDENHVLYWRTSRDGLRWTPRRTLIRSRVRDEWIIHPTIIGDGPDPQIAGRRLWLYHGHAPPARAFPPGAALARRRLTFDGSGTRSSR
jgi:hypothetical protein